MGMGVRVRESKWRMARKKWGSCKEGKMGWAFFGVEVREWRDLDELARGVRFTGGGFGGKVVYCKEGGGNGGGALDGSASLESLGLGVGVVEVSNVCFGTMLTIWTGFWESCAEWVFLSIDCSSVVEQIAQS